MSRSYRYVGPADIRSKATGQPAGTVVTCGADVLRWARQTDQPVAGGEPLAATFVVSLEGRLLVADRRPEHVACGAGGTCWPPARCSCWSRHPPPDGHP